MAAARTAEPSFQMKRVLIVDDSLDQVRSMALLVKTMGHNADYAINGTVGLHLAQRFEPHVVILDIQLPDTSGFEVVRQLRLHPTLKKALVIGVSGRGDIDRDAAVAGGFDEFLTKPLDTARLEKLLGK